jgi:hypothetical protein
MLPATITATNVATTTSFTFEAADAPDNSSLWWADSPQGDLKGRPLMRTVVEINSKGLARTNLLIDVPRYNASTGTYETKSRRFSCTMTSADDDAVASVKDLYEVGAAVLLDLAEGLANQENA